MHQLRRWMRRKDEVEEKPTSMEDALWVARGGDGAGTDGTGTAAQPGSPCPSRTAPSGAKEHRSALAGNPPQD